MKTFNHVMLAISMLGAGCASLRSEPHPFVGALPVRTSLDLSGTFTLSPTGDLILALREGCLATRMSNESHHVVEEACSQARRNAIHVIATTPWQAELAGVWSDAVHLVFHLDWKTASIDVLTDDALAMAARPWKISGVEWQPTAADAQRMLQLVSVATETETAIVQGGAAPALAVTTFEITDGLHAGRGASLVVTIANRGPGVAYRVAATTSSSVAALHGRRVELGTIQPGSEKSRTVHVELPTGETASDAMVVLVTSEGNGFAAANANKRWSIVAAAAELATHCAIPENPVPRPEVAPGAQVNVRCVVSNSGEGAASVALEVSLNGGAPVRSTAQDIVPTGRKAFVVPIVIPRDLAIGAAVELAMAARDARQGRSSTTELHATVRKPTLCDAGKLTRDQYRSKIAQMRATVAEGGLTQAQLDRYDAELVLCLSR